MSTLAKAIASAISHKLFHIDNAEFKKNIHDAIVEQMCKLPIGSELRVKLDDKHRPYLELAVGDERGRLTEIF